MKVLKLLRVTSKPKKSLEVAWVYLNIDQIEVFFDFGEVVKVKMTGGVGFHTFRSHYATLEVEKVNHNEKGKCRRVSMLIVDTLKSLIANQLIYSTEKGNTLIPLDSGLEHWVERCDKFNKGDQKSVTVPDLGS